MSPTMRVLLLIAAFLMTIYIGRSLKKSRLQINDSMFWIFMSFILILFAVFPQIPEWAADLAGVESPVNLVYLLMIFLLIVRNFLMTLRISKLEDKLRRLAGHVAIVENEEHESGT
ncbi:MAG: DUF2304 domain-containing protein [Lachnospiraceae bacterium]|nr:DUF2304 domain-containing protein [Lachnospiraceae bacterium]